MYFFFASKEAYLMVRQLEKITVKKAQAKVVKCAKNKSWVPMNPPGHLSVKVQLHLTAFSESILRRNISSCPVEVKTRAYQIFIRPKLEYASASCNPYINDQVNLLESVQRQAAPFVL